MLLKRSLVTISLIKSDITIIKNVDIIVTSSNELLQGNKNTSYWRFNGRMNVDGAVREALNQKTLDIDLKGKILKPGESCISTSSGKILENNVKYIIHTVVPDGAYGRSKSDEVFSNCYSSCLELAESHHAKSIGFPALGCGIKEWNTAKAAEVAFLSIVKKAKTMQSVDEINFVFKDVNVLNTFKLVGCKLGLTYDEKDIGENDKYSFKIQ